MELFRFMTGTSGTNVKAYDDVAMFIGSSQQKKLFSRGHSRQQRSQSQPKLCWNCGEEGHFKAKCPKPQKPSSLNNSSKNTENAVDDNWGEACFMAECLECLDGLSDAGSMPDLQSVSDSSLDKFLDAGSMLNLQEVLDSGEASGEDMDSENGDGLKGWFLEVREDTNDY